MSQPNIRSDNDGLAPASAPSMTGAQTAAKLGIRPAVPVTSTLPADKVPDLKLFKAPPQKDFPDKKLSPPPMPQLAITTPVLTPENLEGMTTRDWRNGYILSVTPQRGSYLRSTLQVNYEPENSSINPLNRCWLAFHNTQISSSGYYYAHDQAIVMGNRRQRSGSETDTNQHGLML